MPLFPRDRCRESDQAVDEHAPRKVCPACGYYPAWEDGLICTRCMLKDDAIVVYRRETPAEIDERCYLAAEARAAAQSLDQERRSRP